MAADASQLQQLIGNLQNQLALASNMAGHLTNAQQAVPATALDNVGKNSGDLTTLVKSLVDAELQKRNSASAEVTAQVSDKSLFPAALTAEPEALRIAAPAPPVEAPPNMQDMMMKDFLAKLRSAIGGALNSEQQVWVSSNLFGLPEFFNSSDGKETVVAVLGRYKQYLEK